MNLKFMQRAQPTPATGSKTQTSPASLPKASTSQTGTDAFPFTPSSTAKSMKNQRKVIIEAGYAAFPLLLTASGRSRQQQQQTDNSGRQSFGHQEAAPSPQVKRAKSPSTASKIKMVRS